MKMNNSKNEDMSKKNRSAKILFIIATIIIIIVFFTFRFMTSPYSNVIGMELLHDGAMSVEMRVKYFTDSNIAEKYFVDNSIEKYYIFLKTTEPKADEWFDNLNYPIREDGFKYISFLGIGDKLANETASDFLFEESGLKTLKTYDD